MLDDEKRRQRLEKFGPTDKTETEPYKKDYSLIKQSRDFVSDPSMIIESKPRSEFKLLLSEKPKIDFRKIMLFGVNLLNTNDIINYIGGQFVKKLYWLNDFTCIVEFDTEILAKNIYKDYTSCDVSHLSSNNIDENPEENIDFLEKINWKASKLYENDGNFQVNIEMRFAEEGEESKKSDKKDAVFYRFYARNSKNDVEDRRMYKNIKYKKMKEEFNSNNIGKYRSRSRSRS